MDSLNTLILNRSHRYPTLLSLSNLNIKEKPRISINLRGYQSSTITTTPQNNSKNPTEIQKNLSTVPKKRISTHTEHVPQPITRPFALKSSSQKLIFPAPVTDFLNFFSSLPEWIKQEVEKFPEIYYFSTNFKPIHEFSDQNGDYVSNPGDDVFYRYEIKETLGKGTFGKVIKAFDHKENKNIALKIIKNKQRYLDQAHVEIEILKHIKALNGSKYYTVNYENSFVFRGHIVINI